ELGDYNLYASDAALREAVVREGASGREQELTEYGAWLGTAEAADLARQANVDPPCAERFDRRGFRVDKVHFHPAWHVFMQKAFSHGMHCSAWTSSEPGPQVARAAFYLLHGQIEAGTLCPLT